MPQLSSQPFAGPAPACPRPSGTRSALLHGHVPPSTPGSPPVTTTYFRGRLQPKTLQTHHHRPGTVLPRCQAQPWVPRFTAACAAAAATAPGEATERFLVLCDGDTRVGKGEERWRKPFSAGPGTRGRPWEPRCSSGRSGACRGARCWDPPPRPSSRCPAGSCSWGRPGRGHFVFLPRSVRGGKTPADSRGRAFASTPVARGSLPAVSGLPALPGSAGPGGTGMGDDSDLLPAPGQLIRVSFRYPTQFRYSNLARGTAALRVSKSLRRAESISKGKSRGGGPCGGIRRRVGKRWVCAGPRLGPAPAAAPGAAPGVVGAS